jgi:peptidyl-prolyl cis-trans isomerase B (cyclophilin B)
VAGKKERQRRLARERYERRAVRQEQRYQRTRRWTALASVCLLVIALAAGGFFLFRGHGQHADAAATKPAAGATPTPTPAATPTPTPAEPARHCTYTASPPAARDVGMPPARPRYKAKYQATIHTNRGDIVINLRNSKATCTVNSFVFLAAKKYFNDTHCQRLTTSGYFVLQCGDPTGTGKGGPGYKFDDENLAGAKYPAGTVAMANNSAPNTNGSQFFLVYKDSAQLQPTYTPFGTIVSGLNIIQNVAKAGSDNANGPGDGHPKEKVVIKSVTIKKT